MCASKKTVYGASVGETVNITCSVDANPSEVLFHWTINDEEIPYSDNYSFSDDGLVSILTHTPMDESQFGLVSCHAKNIIGVKTCTFMLNIAAEPDPPSGCLLMNHSSDAILVDCVPGFDGNLEQEFHLELYNHKKQRLLSNFSEVTNPVFALHELSSGEEYSLVIYSSNRKGRSKSVVLTAKTQTAINKRFGLFSEFRFSYLSILIVFSFYL